MNVWDEKCIPVWQSIRLVMESVGAYQNEQAISCTLNRISELFTDRVGADCAVCIKALSNTGYIRTYLRDSCHPERWLTDANIQNYRLEDNSAFAKLTSDRSSADFYIDNDLANNTGYVNINPSHADLYNAILVVQFKVHNAAYPGDMPWGFLCIDTLSGRFSEQDARLASYISKELMTSMQNIMGN